MSTETPGVVDASKKAFEESRSTEVPFKALFRRAHGERLRTNYGLVVEPVTFDQTLMGWRLEDKPGKCLRPADPGRKPLCPACED